MLELSHFIYQINKTFNSKASFCTTESLFEMTVNDPTFC